MTARRTKTAANCTDNNNSLAQHAHTRIPTISIHVQYIAVAMKLPCIDHAFAMLLPCICHAVAMQYLALPLQPQRDSLRSCHAVAMQLPCSCHAVAMHLPCICLAVAMQYLALPLQPCIGHAVAMQYLALPVVADHARCGGRGLRTHERQKKRKPR